MRSLRSVSAAASLIFALAALAPSSASGQTLGVDVGLAGIENYDPFTPMIGATLTIPVFERVTLTASYARWTGRDGNEAAFGGGDDLRLGYGNQAFLLSALFRIAGRDGLSLSAGAGTGWFQQFGLRNGSSESVYDATPVGTILVGLGHYGRFAPYFRADVQIPSEPRVSYGLARIGVEIPLRRE